jgi:leader peptidase (prepilin peptidase)/N-methyltransferase
MGALLGFPLFFIALFLSAILALVPSLIWRENGVPFVPFLALATLIIYFFDTEAQFIVNKIIYG